MTVSERDVERVAELANLELTVGDKVRMQRDLNAILDYVAQLNELDTASVRPMAQVAEQMESSEQAAMSTGAAALSTLRPDEVTSSLEREQVLSCAPDTDHIFFRVPKVIER